MINLRSLAVVFSFFTFVCHAQTPADSLAIVSAKWETSIPQKGIISKCAMFKNLYGGPQSVSIVEVQPDYKWKAAIAVPGAMVQLSQIARQHKAIAAINGSYFNMKNGHSVCYLRLGKEVVMNNTSIGEVKMRVNGAIKIKKGKLTLIPWTPAIEKEYKDKHSSVLSSGPLLLHEGKTCTWEKLVQSFINDKHPRSAIATTKEGNILLITVDGRAKDNSIGVNIPELAHLIRILGGTDALNVDGGGSTTLWCDGEVLNYPCDNGKFDHEGERGIPNAIYFF